MSSRPQYASRPHVFKSVLKTQICEIVPSSGRNKTFLLNNQLNVTDHSQELSACVILVSLLN